MVMLTLFSSIIMKIVLEGTLRNGSSILRFLLHNESRKLSFSQELEIPERAPTCVNGILAVFFCTFALICLASMGQRLLFLRPF